MYLRTFGLWLPLPFFLKEGEALHSDASWTSSGAAPAGAPQAVFTGRERRVGRLVPEGPVAGCSQAWPGCEASPPCPQPPPCPTGGRGWVAHEAASTESCLQQPHRTHKRRCYAGFRAHITTDCKNALINNGTQKTQDQEDCQKDTVLSKACTQPPPPSLQEGPLEQKGPAQENRASIHEGVRLTKYWQ